MKRTILVMAVLLVAIASFAEKYQGYSIAFDGITTNSIAVTGRVGKISGKVVAVACLPESSTSNMTISCVTESDSGSSIAGSKTILASTVTAGGYATNPAAAVYLWKDTVLFIAQSSNVNRSCEWQLIVEEN